MAHTPQSKALSIIPHVTGTLSVLGSCWILYDVFIRLKRKHSITTYHRILTGMSVYDAVCSFSLGLSTWPMPIGTEGVYAAVGNTQSCTAQGFFNQLILGSPVYNLMLAIFYLLLGRYHMTEDEIAKKYEIYMHATATIPVIGVAIAGLPLTLYNDANLWCWIASYPPGSEGFNGEHGEEECTRGHGSFYYRWVFFYAPLWFVIVVITIIMIILTASIRAEEKRFIELTHVCQAETSQSRNSMHPVDEERSENTMDDQADQMPLPKHPHTDSYNLERSRKLFYQATFYVGAFYLTWWGPTLNRLIQMATGESYFFFSLVTAIFAPLQGFLNFLIYRHGTIVA